jgi:Domain of unknown function (DUF1772)
MSDAGAVGTSYAFAPSRRPGQGVNMGSMVLAMLATLCAGLFAGAAIYINAVEHPARLACGTALALREFAPSYHRAAVMQASLAVVGTLASVAAWWSSGRITFVLGGLLLGAVVPFTLLGILPTNRRLLAPGLDPESSEADALLRRWGRLHAVRSVLAGLAFAILLVAVAHAPDH